MLGKRKEKKVVAEGFEGNEIRRKAITPKTCGLPKQKDVLNDSLMRIVACLKVHFKVTGYNQALLCLDACLAFKKMSCTNQEIV